MLERSLGTGKIISNASLHSTVSSASSRNLHTLAKNVSPQAKIEKDKSSNKTQKENSMSVNSNSVSANSSSVSFFNSLRARGGTKVWGLTYLMSFYTYFW